MAGQRTSGLFDTTTLDIELPKSKRVILVPFGDIHFGSKHHAADRFKEFIDHVKALSRKELVYFIAMGDMCEYFSTSERAALRGALHDTSDDWLDAKIDELTNKLAEQLKFMKGRVVGVIEGNHSFKHLDGELSDKRFARHLEAPFLGVMGGMLLRLHEGGRSLEYRVCAHHGKPGSAKTVGGGFNRVEDMERVMAADLYMMGDNHKCGVVKSDAQMVLVHSPKLGKPIVKERIRHFAQTGSFTKAYEPGQCSYLADRCAAATSIGHVEIHITMKRRMVQGMDGYGLQVVGIS